MRGSPKPTRRKKRVWARQVAFRRLTREEYRNTIRDLLGVTYDVADPTGLPEDPDWHGFQRIGSVLTISPTHIEKYLTAAEAVLNEAVAVGPQPKRDAMHWDPFLLRSGFAWGSVQKEFGARGIADKVRVDITPNSNAYGAAGGNQLLTIKTTGDYIVRLKLSALRPPGGPAAAAACLCRGPRAHLVRERRRGPGGSSHDGGVSHALAGRRPSDPDHQCGAWPGRQRSR